MTELERQVLYNEIMDNCRRYIDDELYNDKTRQVAYRAMMLACGTVACMPTNDAVEVVRCKDCKWYKESKYSDLQPLRFCYRLINDNGVHIGYKWDDNDFCSYGERKEDANAHNTHSTR